MQDLIINEELRTLLPPLSTEEYTGLEADILRDGCLTPLTIWNGILIDGHNRYEICKKHRLPFRTQNIELENLDDARLWIWKHQSHRRNMTPFERTELALKLKDIIAAKARRHQRHGRKPSDAPIDTRNELAGIANVSNGTLHQAKYVVEHADESTKARLRRGEKGISINSEYKRLKSSDTPPNLPTRSKGVPKKPKQICDMPPENLGRWVIKRFPTRTVWKLIFVLLDHVRNHELAEN